MCHCVLLCVIVCHCVSYCVSKPNQSKVRVGYIYMQNIARGPCQQSLSIKVHYQSKVIFYQRSRCVSLCVIVCYCVSLCVIVCHIVSLNQTKARLGWAISICRILPEGLIIGHYRSKFIIDQRSLLIKGQGVCHCVLLCVIVCHCVSYCVSKPKQIKVRVGYIYMQNIARGPCQQSLLIKVHYRSKVIIYQRSRCVSLCVIVCHCVSLFVIVCHFVSLGVIVCYCVSLCVIVCHCVSLCVTLCHCV